MVILGVCSAVGTTKGGVSNLSLQPVNATNMNNMLR